MKRYKIIFFKKAEKDLENIFSYISCASSEEDALAVTAKIYKKIMRLDIFPERTESFRKEKNGRKLRTTISGRYRIVYIVEKREGKVLIARILHVGRDLKGNI